MPGLSAPDFLESATTHGYRSLLGTESLELEKAEPGAAIELGGFDADVTDLFVIQLVALQLCLLVLVGREIDQSLPGLVGNEPDGWGDFIAPATLVATGEGEAPSEPSKRMIRWQGHWEDVECALWRPCIDFDPGLSSPTARTAPRPPWSSPT